MNTQVSSGKASVEQDAGRQAGGQGGREGGREGRKEGGKEGRREKGREEYYGCCYCINFPVSLQCPSTPSNQWIGRGNKYYSKFSI